MQKKNLYVLLIMLLALLLILIVYLVYEKKIEVIKNKTAIGAMTPNDNQFKISKTKK